MNNTPKGCSNIGGGAAARLEYCRNRTLELFTRYGYRPFSPAELQLVEDVWNKLSPARAQRLIALTSPFGEPCVLRGDLTLSAVAYLDSHYHQNERPLRLCYADRVFSFPRPPRMNLEENQVGVELLGWEGPGAEAEVLTLLFRTLDFLSIEESFVVLGDTSIIANIMAGLPAETIAMLTDALQKYSYTLYREIIASLDLDGGQRELLEKLPSLKGDTSVLAEFMRLTPDKEMAIPLKHLCDSLTKLGFGDRLRIDFGFIRDLGYYTGPVFNAYASVSGTLLGGGGRYDGLLAKIGVEGQAAGFALNLKELADHSPGRYPSPVLMLWCGSGDPADALRYADGLAKKKISFELSWQKEKKESIRIAKLRGYRWWVDYVEKQAFSIGAAKESAMDLKKFEGEVLSC